MTKKDFLANLKKERSILEDALAKIVELNTDGNETIIQGLEELIDGYNMEIALMECVD